MWTNWYYDGDDDYWWRHNRKKVQVRRMFNYGHSVTGEASCSPLDVFDLKLGLKIAYWRMEKKWADLMINDCIAATDKWELAGEISLSYGDSATVYSLNKENEVWVKAKYNGKWYQAVAKATNKIDGQNGLFRVAMLRLRSQLYAAAADKMEGNEC